MAKSDVKQRPAYEIRLGRIKAAVWENETQNGVRHNVTISRLYKDGDRWKDSTSFGREDLPLVAKVADMAHKLGVRSSLKTREGAYVPSLGLGAMGVSPLDMASAYATIAAGGIYSRPMAITKVVLPDGKTEQNESKNGTATWIKAVTHSFDCVTDQHYIVTEMKPAK